MARFAPVVPLHMADALRKYQLGDLLGGYHLLLAHDVIGHKQEYANMYGPGGYVRSCNTDSFIIMDNSIVELGDSCSVEVLLQACDVVKPDCLVIPDVMGYGQGTRDRCEQFMKEWKDISQERGFRGMYVPRLMGVLQGANLEDAMMTYRVMQGWTYCKYFSVPRVFTEQTGSRMKLLCNLYGMANKIHLLGFSDNILDDVSCARMPHVAGIDSAVPIRAGCRSEVLHLVATPNSYGKRSNFWEWPFPEKDDMEYHLVGSNIMSMRAWIS